MTEALFARQSAPLARSASSATRPTVHRGFPAGATPTLDATAPQRIFYGVVIVARLLLYCMQLAVYIARRYDASAPASTAAVGTTGGRAAATESQQAPLGDPAGPLAAADAG